MKASMLNLVWVLFVYAALFFVVFFLTARPVYLLITPHGGVAVPYDFIIIPVYCLMLFGVPFIGAAYAWRRISRNVASQDGLITEFQARKLFQEHMNSVGQNDSTKNKKTITQIEELPTAWVLHYQSILYLETRNEIHAVPGSGPFVISKSSGRFVVANNPLPTAQRVQEAVDRLSELDHPKIQQLIPAEPVEERDAG